MGETEVDEAHAETELAAFEQQMVSKQHDHQPNADPNAADTEAAEAMDDEVDDDRLTPPLQVYPDPQCDAAVAFRRLSTQRWRMKRKSKRRLLRRRCNHRRRPAAATASASGRNSLRLRLPPPPSPQQRPRSFGSAQAHRVGRSQRCRYPVPRYH